MKDGAIRQHFGHVIGVLRDMATASVQMIATSPPYFGLRDYGLEPVVWEPVVYEPMPGLPVMPFPAHAKPDAFAACEHDWGAWSEHKDIREETRHGKTRTTDRFYGDASRRFDGNHQKHAHGQFCLKCGAWRGCLGLEPDPNLYVGHLVQVFREARRVLADDGVLWLNLGDSYARSGGTDVNAPSTALVANTRDTLEQIGSRKQRPPSGLKAKDLIGIPWRAALALQADGWFLRSDVVWAKGASFARDWHGNPMPESVTDRPTRAHETVFLLSKSARYFYDHHAVKEPAVQSANVRSSSFKRSNDGKRAQGIPGQMIGTHRENRPDVAYNQASRNIRDVWAVNTKPYKGAHFAVWPEDLVRPMILAGTSARGHCPECAARWVPVTQRRPARPSAAAIGGDPDR
ncbi:MAG: DNA methyltransferase, partial [Acidobacteriaceae bacterium]